MTDQLSSAEIMRKYFLMCSTDMLFLSCSPPWLSADLIKISKDNRSSGTSSAGSLCSPAHSLPATDGSAMPVLPIPPRPDCTQPLCPGVTQPHSQSPQPLCPGVLVLLTSVLPWMGNSPTARGRMQTKCWNQSAKIPASLYSVQFPHSFIILFFILLFSLAKYSSSVFKAPVSGKFISSLSFYCSGRHYLNTAVT